MGKISDEVRLSIEFPDNRSPCQQLSVVSVTVDVEVAQHGFLDFWEYCTLELYKAVPQEIKDRYDI